MRSQASGVKTYIGQQQLRRFGTSCILLVASPPPSPPPPPHPPSPSQYPPVGNNGNDRNDVNRRPPPSSGGGSGRQVEGSTIAARLRNMGDLGYEALGALVKSMNQTANQFSQQESQERHFDKTSLGTWRSPSATKNTNYDNHDDDGMADKSDTHQNIILLAIFIAGTVAYCLHLLTYGHVLLTTKRNDQLTSMFDYMGTDLVYFQRRYLVRYSFADVPILPTILQTIKASQPWKCVSATFAPLFDGTVTSLINFNDNERSSAPNVSQTGVLGKTLFISGGAPGLPCYRHPSDVSVRVVKDPHTNQDTMYRYTYNRLLYRIIPFRSERVVGLESSLGEVLRENMLTFQTHGRLEKSDMFEKLAGSEEVETAYWSKPRGAITDANNKNAGKIDLSVSVRPYGGKGGVTSEQILHLRMTESFTQAMRIHVFEAVRSLSHAKQGNKDGLSVRSEQRRAALTEQMMRSGAISSLDLTVKDLITNIADGSLPTSNDNDNSSSLPMELSRESIERVQRRLAEDVWRELDRRSHDEYLVSSVTVKIHA